MREASPALRERVGVRGDAEGYWTRNFAGRFTFSWGAAVLRGRRFVKPRLKAWVEKSWSRPQFALKLRFWIYTRGLPAHRRLPPEEDICFKPQT